MKKILIASAMCLACLACSRDNYNNNSAQSEQNSPDWEITTKVKSSILSDTTISASARFVTVNTTNGVVTLAGSVPTREDREKIVKMTKKVHGVVRVIDKITISNK
jgi:hyperosmotically inducible protein